MGQAVTTTPLFAHSHAGAVIAYRQVEGAVQTITAAQFVADIHRVAAELPTGRHILNSCGDRYHFAVGLMAAALHGKISLLPSTHTPQSVREMRNFAPDVFCLTDDPDSSIELPTLFFPEEVSTPPLETFAVPALDDRQTVAYVFTSGSTGVPVPHAKTWGALAGCVEVEAERLQLCDGRAHTIVATVPAQHMYGFESSVLVALRSGNAFWSGKPFYAADINAALAAVPAPRLLVSTPFHLRALLAAQLPRVNIERALSATAPLGAEFAQELETYLDAPLLEIYGCTETGQIATRRPACEVDWWLFDGVELDEIVSPLGVQTIAYGGHIDGRIALADVITRTTEHFFQLQGRTADMVNIAGKRASLAYLNVQLTAIPGVLDGVFINSAINASGAITRLTAIVVAPGLNQRAVTAALRERIDPVFLPRPLYIVAALPRNAAGKLPQSALQELLQQLGSVGSNEEDATDV